MIASGNEICFFFIVNIEKIKIRITKETLTKVRRRNHYSKQIFSWVLLNPRTTDPPINRRTTTYPPTQRLAESIIIFERLGNRDMLFCRTQAQLGKHLYLHLISIIRYIVFCPNIPLVSIKHIRRRQL